MGVLKRLPRWLRAIGGADPIKHVVVLMFENHSFDQMLGCFKSVYPELEGVDPTNPRANGDSTGQIYLQSESRDTIVSPDPRHELDHVLAQLKELLSNVVDGKFLGGGLLGFDSVDKRNSLNHVG